MHCDFECHNILFDRDSIETYQQASRSKICKNLRVRGPKYVEDDQQQTDEPPNAVTVVMSRFQWTLYLAKVVYAHYSCQTDCDGTSKSQPLRDDLIRANSDWPVVLPSSISIQHIISSSMYKRTTTCCQPTYIKPSLSTLQLLRRMAHVEAMLQTRS